METRLSLDNVTIEFPLLGASNQSLKKTVLATATGGKVGVSGGLKIVTALNRISLDLRPGMRLGLVGHNGAGKTTLLRAMAGIYPPTSGYVRQQGRVAPLFGIQAGMDPNATGLENIWLRSLLTGMSVEEIRSKIDEIAEFSGLGPYLHIPLRTYSSGMRLRLSFAIATCQAPEILLLDEWIGAGDNEFAQQARQRMNELVEKASIVVLASHNKMLINNICNYKAEMKSGEIGALEPITAKATKKTDQAVQDTVLPSETA